MSDNASSSRAAIDAILARDRLRLPQEEYERLVALYPEIQAQLATLRGPELSELEPTFNPSMPF